MSTGHGQARMQTGSGIWQREKSGSDTIYVPYLPNQKLWYPTYDYQWEYTVGTLPLKVITDGPSSSWGEKVDSEVRASEATDVEKRAEGLSISLLIVVAPPMLPKKTYFFPS